MLAAPFLTLLAALLCQEHGEPASPPMRVPADFEERLVWAERALDPGTPEAVQEAAIRMLASAIPDSLDALGRAAASPHWRVRAAALDAAVRGSGSVRTSRDRTRLRQLALGARQDLNRAVRRQVARLLAEAGDAGEPVLPELTRDPFFDVRIEAMRAIARGGSTSAVPTIAALLHDPDPLVAAATIDVLPRLGRAGIAALAPFLSDAATPDEHRDRALRALREAGSIEGAEDDLAAIAENRGFPSAARVLAHALLLVHGASRDPAAALSILTSEVVASADLTVRDAAVEGLLALGPRGVDEVRGALLDERISARAFERLLSAFPRIARQEAPKALVDVLDRLDAARDGERAAVVQALARAAPPGSSVKPRFADLARSRYAESGSRTRREFLRAFRTRMDAPADFLETALSDESADLRRLAFAIAIRSREVPTETCLVAIENERDLALRGEFLETLPRHRRDADARAYLLQEIGRGEGENVESAVAGLDAFAGDEELVESLTAVYEDAYARQLEEAGDSASHRARRARCLAVRAVGRIGGRRAVPFLEGVARAERALDEGVATEAVRALAAVRGDSPVLRAILTPPSLPAVRIEGAIAVLRRGDAQGLFALASQIRALDGDTRRRAFDAMAAGRPAQRREFLVELATDPKGVFREESRADAIRELAFLPGNEGLDILKRIASHDRSFDARVEAVQALARIGGDEVADFLGTIAAAVSERRPRTDLDELWLRACVVALGNARSPRSTEFLVTQLFERPLAEATTRLLDPDARRSPLERRRRYDRELEASSALTRLGPAAVERLDARVTSLAARGELQLVDPLFLLELAQGWGELFPQTALRLAELAPSLGGDSDLRIRALLVQAQLVRDRRAAAGLFEAAHALSAAGGADAGVVASLGPTDPFVGRRPRLWLAAAPLLVRAEIAFAEQRPDEGARFLEAAVRKAGMDTRCLVDVAAVYAAHGSIDRARDLAARAYELAPNDRALAETYAWLCLQNGEAALANELFQYALGLDEDEVANPRSARFGAACALAELRRPEEAVEILRALLREDPDLADEIWRSPHLASVRPMLQIGGAEAPPGAR